MKSFSVRIMVGRKVNEVIIAAENEEGARRAGGRKGQVLGVKQIRSGVVFKPTMNLNDRLVFFQRLASMVGSKVGVSESLDIIFQSFTGSVREAARILRDQIEHGATLYEAMETAGPRYFPDTVVAIVRTGSRGGDMAYALREAARFERELEAVKKESGKGMMSALAGFVSGILTILGSTLYVAPKILESSLVKQGGKSVDVGWILTMSDIITVIAILAASLVGGLFLFGVVFRPLAPAFVDRVVMKIPFYRDMALAKTNYMVFFGMAVLLKAGLRVEECLRLTVDSSPKGELRNDLDRALTAIVKGSKDHWAYSMTMLHPTDKAALATAQSREQTASTIEELALQYQSIYRSRLELFVPIVQIFAAIFLSLAGFVLFGVSIVPLMQSTSAIMKNM